MKWKSRLLITVAILGSAALAGNAVARVIFPPAKFNLLVEHRLEKSYRLMERHLADAGDQGCRVVYAIASPRTVGYVHRIQCNSIEQVEWTIRHCTEYSLPPYDDMPYNERPLDHPRWCKVTG